MRRPAPHKGLTLGVPGLVKISRFLRVALRYQDATGEMARSRAGELYAKARLAIGKLMPISALAGASSKLPVATSVACFLQVLLPNVRQGLSTRTQGGLRSGA